MGAQDTGAKQVTPRKRSVVSCTQVTPKKTKTTSTVKTPVKLYSREIQVKPLSEDKCVGHRFGTADQSTQLALAPVSIEMISDNDRILRKYTGMDSYSIFLAVHKYMTNTCGCSNDFYKDIGNPSKVFTSISTENQMLLCLYKLRMDPPEHKIAQEMGVSIGLVSTIFKFWVRLMFRKFKIINTNAPLQQLRKIMPLEVKQVYPNLREIYDATEIQTQKPTDPLAQKQLWSNYKHSHTVKIQVGCDASGTITSLSDTYGGSISDKDLFVKSKVTGHLEPGEAIMVDKGYLIQDELQGTGVQLLRPPYLKAGTQFEEHDLTHGRTIARHRGVIENVNSRIKCFKILSHKLPVNVLPLANEIVFICSFLTTLDPPFRR